MKRDLIRGIYADIPAFGDREVVLDFIAYLRGEPTSPGKTLLEDSVYGHRIVFLAEKSRLANGAIQEW